MQTHKKQIFLFSSLALLLSSCADYTASVLDPLSMDTAVIHAENQNQNVLVSWKFFNAQDCQTYLGRDVLNEGYIPAQITIRNHSSDPMYLQAGNFSIPFSPASEVASSVHTSTAGRALGWGIPGLFIWPFLIPAIYDGILSSNANDALDADYAAKAVNEHIIQPHSSFNGVVFIPKGKMKESIDMFLVNQRTSEKLSFTGLNRVVR